MFCSYFLDSQNIKTVLRKNNTNSLEAILSGRCRLGIENEMVEMEFRIESHVSSCNMDADSRAPE